MAMGLDSSLDLRLLTPFLTLADELHFSRAAERLHIAQPALSQQIARLERQLGFQLFDRPPRPIALTAAGRALLDRVSPALALLEQGVLDGQALASEQLANLSVGHLSSFARRLMPLVVASLRDTHPVMTLRLHQADLLELLAAVRSGRTHVSLIHTNPDLSLAMGGLHSATIAAGPRMLVMRADNPLASDTEVVLSDAADQSFILPSDDRHAGYRAATEGACRRYGFVPRPAALANDVGVAFDMVAAGAGVLFAPWISVGSMPFELVARPLADERCELVALTLPQAPVTVSAVIAAAREAARLLDHLSNLDSRRSFRTRPSV
jgi:LysR family transcriptional regulator, benzoate and cis,cis-muconate-responsive activator of ben and cat genes